MSFAWAFVLGRLELIVGGSLAEINRINICELYYMLLHFAIKFAVIARLSALCSTLSSELALIGVDTLLGASSLESLFVVVMFSSTIVRSTCVFG